MSQRISRHPALRPARLALTAVLAAGVCACALPAKFAGPSGLAVDPNSPVSKDVLYASSHPGPYPRFSDIPEVPTDLRPASEWRAAVADLQRRKAILDAQVDAFPPAQTDTEAFAAQHRSEAAAQPSEVPPPDAQEQTQAYARALRERATPPPPPR